MNYLNAFDMQTWPIIILTLGQYEPKVTGIKPNATH